MNGKRKIIRPSFKEKESEVPVVSKVIDAPKFIKEKGNLAELLATIAKGMETNVIREDDIPDTLDQFKYYLRRIDHSRYKPEEKWSVFEFADRFNNTFHSAIKQGFIIWDYMKSKYVFANEGRKLADNLKDHFESVWESKELKKVIKEEMTKFYPGYNLPSVEIELEGFPKWFWVVTKPKDINSTLEDIYFETSIVEFIEQFKGGLTWEEIHGLYGNERTARLRAEELLGQEGV